MKARNAALRFLAIFSLLNLLVPGVGAQIIVIDPLPFGPLPQITGYVRDSSGHPITNVLVTGFLAPSTFKQSYTDTTGWFALTVWNGTWDVSVDCMGDANSLQTLGYQCVNDETVVISNANGTANFVTPPQGTAELSGTVSNIYGTLITNIIVDAWPSDNKLGSAHISGTFVNGFYQFALPAGVWNVAVSSDAAAALGYSPSGTNTATIGSYPNQYNVDNINFTLAYAPPPIPFFTNQAALGNYAYYLQPSSNNFFGYYSLQNFPFVYHFDLGWEYLVDAQNAANGAYIYDFKSGDWWYTEPGIFPYIYDFNFQAWLYCYPNTSAPGTYYSNPRIFYNFGTSNTWFD